VRVDFSTYVDDIEAVAKLNVDVVVPDMPKDPLTNGPASAAPIERATAAAIPKNAFEGILINLLPAARATH
jgi:hypothetical protein